MSSRAAYTPPPPTQLTSSPRRSSHVRVRPTAVAAATAIPAPPKLPRELKKARAPQLAPPKKAPPKKAAKKPALVAAVEPRKTAPPPAAAALALLSIPRATETSFENDTIEMDPPVVEEATEQVPVPELRAAETHRKLAAREKRQKKLARARVNEKRTRAPDQIAGEKSGIRKKVARTAAPGASGRKSAPPPIPAAAKKPRVAPPPVPAKAKSVPPPPPKRSVAPPPPRTSLAAFATAAAPAAPTQALAKVLHIPSREPTQQFLLPTREASTNAPVIPLSRVAPNEIAVPLVPTTPMPLTQPRSVVAPPVGLGPAASPRAAFAPTPAAPMRQDTQQILLSAPAPFVDDADEDLLAPYTSSPLRALSKAISSFFEH